MGKSQGGAIWLNGDMLSPYEFWQFWRNTTDADTGKFLKIFTELPVEECDRLGTLEGSDINAAKIILANEVTTLLHGAEAAKTAEATAHEVFEKGGVGDDLPTLTLSAADIGDGISIVQLIVKSGLAGSGKEAKRLITENGARYNDAPLTDAGLMVDAATLATPHQAERGQKNATRWYNWVKLSEVCEGGGRALPPPLAFGFLFQHKPLGLCILQLFIPLDQRIGRFLELHRMLGIQRRVAHQFFKLCDLGFQTFHLCRQRLKPVLFCKAQPRFALRPCASRLWPMVLIWLQRFGQSHPAGAVPDNLSSRRQYTVALPSPSIAMVVAATRSRKSRSWLTSSTVPS